MEIEEQNQSSWFIRFTVKGSGEIHHAGPYSADEAATRSDILAVMGAIVLGLVKNFNQIIH